MEVDGAILARAVSPAKVLARPVVPGDGAGRQVHGAPVQPVRRDIGDGLAVDVAREVPGAERRCHRQLGHLALAQHSGGQARRLELAVVVAAGREAGRRRRLAPSREEERCVRPCHRGRSDRADSFDGTCAQEVAGERRLGDAGHAVPRMVARRHPVPLVRDEPFSGRNESGLAGAAAEHEGHGPALEHQRESAPALVAPPSDQRLAPVLRSRRPDQDLNGEGLQSIRCRVRRNDDAGAQAYRLPPARVAPRDRALHLELPAPRPLGVIVGAQQAHDPRLVVRSPVLAAHHEAKDFPGGRARLFAVAQNGDHAPPSRYSRFVFPGAVRESRHGNPGRTRPTSPHRRAQAPLGPLGPWSECAT